MSLPLPEQSPTRTVVQSALFGLLSGLPGLGAVAGAIQGAMQAASRSRDEDWWAMVAARVLSLEDDVKRFVHFDDPEFVAAAHKFTRAAQETADEEKRRRLAAALSHSGSWSELPRDERERIERALIDLTSREVLLLRILDDPRGWLAGVDAQAALSYEQIIMGSFAGFINEHVVAYSEIDAAAANAGIAELQSRLLVGTNLTTTVTGSSILTPKTTPGGAAVIRYLKAIGD
jgi:hypothetical protein